jgi:hypothetical protein
MTSLELEHRIRWLVAELRNSRDVQANWSAVRELVEGDTQAVVSALSLRWLKSVCDTYADLAGPAQAAHALNVSNFLNMLRFAETIRKIRPVIEPSVLEVCRPSKTALYEGLTTFSIDKQDVFLNMCKRMERQFKNDNVVGAIWRAVLSRLHAGDNAITEFARLSTMPERYFPIEALSMADNHGVVGLTNLPTESG